MVLCERTRTHGAVLPYMSQHAAGAARSHHAVPLQNMSLRLQHQRKTDSENASDSKKGRRTSGRKPRSCSGRKSSR
ncbi:DNA-directed RNA polymerase III RPC11 [Toxoplasma gondii ARI]|uniref:DNA-directed RNA polymerase III RPC11 n=3 Tax=Toxoplasma gondii TaxID=5811 RepID=A0A086QZ89_TOXGO|nr:DNA-directed RNA polymerase III RPC11 [Toxoplasma gondii FOU]KFH17921.1 DNA-directed RNA polymerase III RPC11 [Toxoplasma gondii MAS]KYF48070.1 DNA-directed RNA polymerase III RPC11 [Toxoplasma gondii ARI]